MLRVSVKHKQIVSSTCVILINATGKQVSHSFAKSLLAGFVGAEVDKLAETKGEDAWDRHKAKEQAKHRAEKMYDEHYIDGQGADSYDPNRYDSPNFRY